MKVKKQSKKSAVAAAPTLDVPQVTGSVSYQLINGNCLDVLKTIEPVKCIFADPFDNIGLGYNQYKDVMPEDKYLQFLEDVLWAAVYKADIVWWSFNAKWTFAMGRIFERLIKEHDRPGCHKLVGKACVQVFTFGQHNKNDFGNNHRPLWRLMWEDAKLYPENVKVPSWRQRNGDKRAAPGGRVPGDVLDFQYPELSGSVTTHEYDKTSKGLEGPKVSVDHEEVWPGDVMDFPRVTGNSKQRCDWHPTQLHEELVERCILMSTEPGDKVADPFGGTATTYRVCKKIERSCTLIELDADYCDRISKDHGIPIRKAA